MPDLLNRWFRSEIVMLLLQPGDLVLNLNINQYRDNNQPYNTYCPRNSGNRPSSHKLGQLPCIPQPYRVVRSVDSHKIAKSTNPQRTNCTILRLSMFGVSKLYAAPTAGKVNRRSPDMTSERMYQSQKSFAYQWLCMNLWREKHSEMSL